MGMLLTHAIFYSMGFSAARHRAWFLVVALRLVRQPFLYAAMVARKRGNGIDSSVNILCRLLCIVSIFSSRLLDMCERHAVFSVSFQFYRRDFWFCAVAMLFSLYRSTGDLSPSV